MMQLAAGFALNSEVAIAVLVNHTGSNMDGSVGSDDIDQFSTTVSFDLVRRAT